MSLATRKGKVDEVVAKDVAKVVERMAKTKTKTRTKTNATNVANQATRLRIVGAPPVMVVRVRARARAKTPKAKTKAKAKAKETKETKAKEKAERNEDAQTNAAVPFQQEANLLPGKPTDPSAGKVILALVKMIRLALFGTLATAKSGTPKAHVHLVINVLSRTTQPKQPQEHQRPKRPKRMQAKRKSLESLQSQQALALQLRRRQTRKASSSCKTL